MIGHCCRSQPSLGRLDTEFFPAGAKKLYPFACRVQ